MAVIITGLISLSQVYSQNGEGASVQTKKGPKYGSDSASCVVHLSLYREFVKQNNFKDALPQWRWVYNNCPLATENIYIDGVKMFTSLVQQATDPVLREKYVDTLFMIYDRRVENFNREAYVLGRKGIEMTTYRPGNVEDNYNTLKRSVELGGPKTESATLAYYFQTVLGMVQQQKLETSAVVEAYDVASTIIDHNLAANTDNEKNLALWNSVKANIELAFEPFASCDDLINLYTKKYTQTPDDVELLSKMTSMLEKKKCTNSDLFFTATEKLHKLQPSAQSAYLMATLSREKRQTSKAIEYLNQAIDLSDNNDEKIRALNMLAVINYEQNNYPQARANAQRILQLNPSFGKAYIFIGDLYAASSTMCAGDDLAGKTVFWAAIDMYQKARSVDPSVADEANSKIAQYSRYFPAKDDLFFRDLGEGTPYAVGCWINENTTVRSAK